MNSRQLMDSAYTSASKEASRTAIHAKNPLVKKQRREQILLKEMAVKIIYQLKEKSKKIPSIEKFDPFTLEMVSSIEKPEKLMQASSQLNKSLKVIKKIQINSSKQIFKAKNPDDVIKVRKQFMARTHSVLKSLEKNIKIIEKFEKKQEKNPFN
ncbi:MAG: hypothetical protein ABIA76_00430 [Candidatus Diapherotrites archaeon]